jgi:hypothetical protein
MRTIATTGPPPESRSILLPSSAGALVEASRSVSRWWCSAPAVPGGQLPVGIRAAIVDGHVGDRPANRRGAHAPGPLQEPVEPGPLQAGKASAPPRRRRRDCHCRAAQPAGEHRQRQSCWRPRPRSKAGGRGECRTRSRSCLDHGDQGVPTRRLASRSPISVQHRRQSRCRGCRPWPSPARCSFTTGSPADQASRRSTTCRERADPQARRRGPWTVSSRVEVAGAHLPDVGCPAVGFKR